MSLVDRRDALRILGSCAVTAGVAPRALVALEHHPLVPQVEGVAWRPRFLSEHENETTVALAELIIPATDTPGAAAAKVNEYIDYVLSQAPAEEQESFRRGLAWIDRRSQELDGRDFVALDQARQTQLLVPLTAPDTAPGQDPAGVAFFEDVKRRTIDGYYRSEIGIVQELRFEGYKVLARFEGCTHREHLEWQPARRDD